MLLEHCDRKVSLFEPYRHRSCFWSTASIMLLEHCDRKVSLFEPHRRRLRFWSTAFHSCCLLSSWRRQRTHHIPHALDYSTRHPRQSATLKQRGGPVATQRSGQAAAWFSIVTVMEMHGGDGGSAGGTCYRLSDVSTLQYTMQTQR